MIGEPRFRLERLSESHRRAFFKCARESALERYLVDDNRALRENARSISAVHVLLDSDADDRIAGYFSLASTSVVPESVPKNIARKLPRYDRWPAALVGRMARDDDYDGHDLGIILVALAFQQALEIAKRSACSPSSWTRRTTASRTGTRA